MAGEKSVGGIWLNEGNGKKYLSISLEINGDKLGFVAFKNDRRENDKAPIYRIFPKRQPQRTKSDNPDRPDECYTPSSAQPEDEAF